MRVPFISRTFFGSPSASTTVFPRASRLVTMRRNRVHPGCEPDRAPGLACASATGATADVAASPLNQSRRDSVISALPCAVESYGAIGARDALT